MSVSGIWVNLALYQCGADSGDSSLDEMTREANGESDRDSLFRLLTEIRDNQSRQLEQLAHALELQERQFSLVREQHERATRIQERAESLQDKSTSMVDRARKVFFIVIPLLLVLLVYATWLLFSYF